MQKTLIKTSLNKSKRRGRGYGSGKGGHTTGRGQKGQKSRGKIGILFEGIKVKKSFIKRLPLRRGKGKFKAGQKPLVVRLGSLNSLASGSKVDLGVLIKNQIVSESDAHRLGVKILADGKLTKKLEVSLPVSEKAAKEIEKQGGKITVKIDNSEKAKN